jgi:transcriptional regulator with XRE-family HTH domain
LTQSIMNELGRTIRELRLSKSMTQQELAEKSDLSLPFINLIENNKRSVSLETLEKLLKALDISFSDFFLPFSQNNDKKLEEFLTLLSCSSNKDKLIDLFTQFLQLSNG